MFRVGDLVTPDPSKFSHETRTFTRNDGSPAYVVQLTGKVCRVSGLSPLGSIYIEELPHVGPFLIEYWRHANIEILKSIKRCL